MIPERDVRDSVWSDVLLGDQIDAIDDGCADSGEALTTRISSDERMQLQVLGVWCPGCGGWVCDDCRYRLHGEPVPTHG